MTRQAHKIAGLLAATIALASPGLAQQEQVIRGLFGEALGTTASIEEAFGGQWSTPLGPQNSAAPLASNVFRIHINRNGTGWSERFLLGMPAGGPQVAPVLVLFHGYGQDPEDLYHLTTFFQEATARGWYVVAPLAAHKFSFSIEYAQRNVEAVLAWVATYMPVDIDRFYGVGFSMGGGMATSYAARHMDPLHARFAAIVNHTGSTSMSDVYWNAGDKALLQNPLMFGGTPDSKPFEYTIASTIDIDLLTQTVRQSNDMARNLAHVPVRNFMVRADINKYLRKETKLFHDQLLARDGTSEHQVNPGGQHVWSTLDETQTLDWLAPHSLTQPGVGQLHRTLADRDGRWHGFHVTQHQAGEFTPFQWYASTQRNRLYVVNAENLAQLAFEVPAVGLTNQTPFELIYGAADGQDVDIVLRGFSQAPTDVRRNGSSTGAWSWDPVTGTVTLFETSSGSFPRWRVLP